MKIYTKTGDQGETGILGGIRVTKDDAVICSVGEVDEVNSQIGLIVSIHSDEGLSEFLEKIQSDLFVLGSQIANCRSGKSDKVSIEKKDIEKLEQSIDLYEQGLPQLNAFILPGGHPVAHSAMLPDAFVDAERSLVHLMGDGSTKSDLSLGLIYLNRLSDLLFVLARHVNFEKGENETSWLPGQ